MAEWVQREFSKGEIDRAGDVLVPWWTADKLVYENPQRQSEVAMAWHVAQNFRASHARPLLTFRMALTSRAKRVAPEALIAQRLKRISSVLNKLARERNMKLSQMQDLGGCRAIVPNMEGVDRLFDLYRRPMESLFEPEGSLKCYDYIRNPKPDGYRGSHVVGRYRARKELTEAWNGHRIEVQLRTRLQHAFATAVETVTTFTRHPLKFRGGPEEWRRFFALTGSAFALREGTSYVDGTPTDVSELTRELRDIVKALKVRPRLAGWARALKKLPRHDVAHFKWLLLVLNVTEQHD